MSSNTKNCLPEVPLLDFRDGFPGELLTVKNDIDNNEVPVTLKPKQALQFERFLRLQISPTLKEEFVEIPV